MLIKKLLPEISMTGLTKKSSRGTSRLPPILRIPIEVVIILLIIVVIYGVKLHGLIFSLWAIPIYVTYSSLRKREKTIPRPSKYLTKGKYGVYFIDVLDVHDHSTIDHGKLGHGVVEQRLQAHRTAVGPMKVRGVVYTHDKTTAYQLEQRIKRELHRANQIVPYDGEAQRAVELYYPSEKSYQIIDKLLDKVGAPSESYL